MTLHIGCHLSSSKGYFAMGKEALSLGADTFQFFTRNPRGSKAKPFDAADAAALCAFLEEHAFAPLIAHAPYTLNAASAEERTRQFAELAMREDLARLAHIPNCYYNFHPGSHVGQGAETGISLIAGILNRILTPGQETIVLLETMAGKGTEIGRSFEELRAIIDRVELSDKLGVCLDTCHVHDAGYDIVGNLDGVLAEFDRVIGIERLKAVHLNDSMNPCGSHKDRHEKIGDGHIGLPAFERIVKHPALRGLPFCLETPNDLDGYRREIELLRNGGRHADMASG